MCPSSELQYQCTRMKCLEIQNRCDHDQDYVLSSNSLKDCTKMGNGLKEISYIATSLFNIIPSICDKQGYHNIFV